MISSPLFRPGDRLHYINNLTTGNTYPMIHQPDTDCRISEYANSWCRNNSGNVAEITEITSSGTYWADAVCGTCDMLYQEAARVGAYLLNTPMPSPRSIFTVLWDNPDDLTGDTDWTGFAW